MADQDVQGIVLDCRAAIEERLGSIEEQLRTLSPDVAAAILDALADLDERVTALTEALDVDTLAKRVAERLEQRFEVVPDEPA